LEDHRDEISAHITEGYDYIDMENFLGEVKTAMVIEAWINEVTENDLLERYNVQPGDRYSAVTNGEWLLYATQELAKILGLNEFRREISQLRTRVKHGVSMKLLPLVRLKGIGRVRAKVLYKSGFTTQAKLKRASLRQLTAIPLIGARLSKSIKEQVGGLVDEVEWKRLDKMIIEQSSLTSFVEEEYEEEQDDD